MMGIWSDLKVLYHLNLKSIRGNSHAERLENFYRSQADDYDAYREKLLHGRRELWQQLDVPQDGIWVDMGGGTGSNLEFLGDRIHDLKRIYIVDLCPSLLEVAARRVKTNGWTNVELVQADALTFDLADKVDIVTFSYSLTMMPDWFAALERAKALLRPGGQIGVVDFYHSRKYPDENQAKHSWLTRTFWRTLLSRDNVFMSPDHLPFLRSQFFTCSINEHLAKVPYILFLKIPYYVFVGEKSLTS